MESWIPLAEISEFRDALPSSPPPLPPSLATVVANDKHEASAELQVAAGPWGRFFARIFDLWVQALLLGIPMGVVFTMAPAIERTVGRSDILLSMAMLPFALLLDAAIHALFGNTPGKAMLGLSVVSIDGTKLGFGQHLSRNVGLWANGLALGFPLINLATMAKQASLVSKGKLTSYDESNKTQVLAKAIGIERKLLFAVMFGGLILLMVVLSALGKIQS
jgi:uncharacterized RDD family membrane protein YckC